METVGLVLGKFAPLHKGHEYLIQYAEAMVDRLYVLVYEDEGLSKVPLAKRAGWIRQLFPSVTVIEGHGSPTRTGLDAETIRVQDAYVKSVVPERITHFFASEKYVSHIAQALRATPVMVDQERIKLPISATRIRDNPYEMRHWVHPLVYRDLVTKVVILGAESTGKTTLVEALAKYYNTTHAAEHGREYWVKHNVDGRLTGAQLEQLAIEHRVLESCAIGEARRVCFTDTNAFTTLQFAWWYGATTTFQLEQMAHQDMGPDSRHDVRIVCGTDIPFVQDGTRNEAARDRFQAEIITELRRRRQPVHIVTGSVEERVRQVQSILDIPV